MRGASLPRSTSQNGYVGLLPGRLRDGLPGADISDTLKQAGSGKEHRDRATVSLTGALPTSGRHDEGRQAAGRLPGRTVAWRCL
jgi:hypothetical protein